MSTTLSRPPLMPSNIHKVAILFAGGPAPVRAYMHELMPDVLEGRIEPGLVFDRITDIDGVPDGYRAMNERESIKVMIRFLRDVPQLLAWEDVMTATAPEPVVRRATSQYLPTLGRLPRRTCRSSRRRSRRPAPC